MPTNSTNTKNNTETETSLTPKHQKYINMIDKTNKADWNLRQQWGDFNPYQDPRSFDLSDSQYQENFGSNSTMNVPQNHGRYLEMIKQADQRDLNDRIAWARANPTAPPGSYDMSNIEYIKYLNNRGGRKGRKGRKSRKSRKGRKGRKGRKSRKNKL